MIFSAASMDLALRSFILISAMSRTCALVIVPTLVLCGSPLLLHPGGLLDQLPGAGGVLVMKENDRSS